MKASDYRKLLHRFFDGEVSARDLRAKGLPTYSRRRTRPGIQKQIDFGAGARGPKTGDCADDGARSRQPH